MIYQPHKRLSRDEIALAFLSACLCLFLMAKDARAALETFPVAKLKSLDKITARTNTFKIRVGETVEYGPLLITLRTCRKAPPIEPPRTAAFLEIIEQEADQRDQWVFSGWMFASSPALSSMDHPVYDVWVIDCLEDTANLAEGDDAPDIRRNVGDDAAQTADQPARSLEQTIQDAEYTQEAIEKAREDARQRAIEMDGIDPVGPDENQAPEQLDTDKPDTQSIEIPSVDAPTMQTPDRPEKPSAPVSSDEQDDDFDVQDLFDEPL